MHYNTCVNILIRTNEIGSLWSYGVTSVKSSVFLDSERKKKREGRGEGIG